MSLLLLWNSIPKQLKLILMVILVAAAAFFIGKYSNTQKTKIKTQFITQTVVVNHHDIRTVVHTVKEPNGTVVTNTTTQDNSTVTGNGIKVAKSKETESGSTTSGKWKISALAGVDFKGGNLAYGAELDRKILGPIYVGAWGLSNSSFGVSIGFQF